jgi:hypothetical protein
MSVSFDSLPAPRALPPTTGAAIKRALRQEMRPRRRPSWRLVAGGVVVAGLATGAAGYLAFRSAPIDKIQCYAEQSTNFDRDTFLGTTVAFDANRPDPVTQCSRAWQDGLLSPAVLDGGAPDPTRFGTYTVPELHACVLPNGVAAVFPADEGVCARLGLSGYRADAQ